VSTDLPDSNPDGLARRRALWALVVLALVAVIISAITVFLIGGSSGTHQDTGLPAATDPASASPSTSSTPPSPSAASSSAHPSPSSSSPSAAAVAACPTPAPCVLQGDAGHAGAAIDAYRASHQLPSVPTSVSPAAQSCALSSGDGPSCGGAYFWEPVGALDGAALVAKLASHSKASAFLLDPTATAFVVGWAYAPGAAGAAGQVEAAIVKAG
jgi:hypothetical protein